MKVNEQILNRKERERRMRRDDIVSAAREVFALRGFSNATLDEIAEKAEFGKGTLYNYFQNKDELFEAVIAHSFDCFIEIAQETCLDPSLSLLESFDRFTAGLLEHLFENAKMHALMMRELHKPGSNSHLLVLLPDLLEIIEQPLLRAEKLGAMKDVSIPQSAFLFLSMILMLFGCETDDRICLNYNGFSKSVSSNDDSVCHKIDRIIHLIHNTFFTGILHSGNSDNQPLPITTL